MSHHNDGMQFYSRIALCKWTVIIISAFHLYILACLCLCVLFRSPAQRKANSLSPTHSTNAQTVLKLEENIDTQTLAVTSLQISTSFEPPRQHGCTCLGFRLLLFFFTQTHGRKKCDRKQVSVKQNEAQTTSVIKRKFLIRICDITHSICCEVSLILQEPTLYISACFNIC